MTMSEENTQTDSWDGLLADYLKAEDLTDEETVVVCIDVKRNEDRLDLIVNYKEKKYTFTLNKTNMAFLKKEGELSSPRAAIGKKITVRKTTAMNPQLKREVPTLRISKVE